MDEIAIKVDNVSKTFKLPHEKQSSIKGALISKFKGGKRSFERQEVLKDVSFEIKKGEFFGIVGRNGSGKSTLLKMLAGIYAPNKGSIQVNGKLTPFIELGVGFNPELTGRENVFLNGALLGFNRAEMSAMYDDIVSFAELEKFMDQKLKNYSSGMQVRLAFSIAIRAKSDILLIDEVLAVGDAAFQTKCFDYFQSLKGKGITVVFVSHDRAALERFCPRGILIDDGDMIKFGSMQEVLKEYSEIVMAELDHSSEDTERLQKNTKQSVYATINNTMTCASGGGMAQKRFHFGDDIYVQYKVLVKKEIINPIFGVTIHQKNIDRAIFATNTLIENKLTGSFKSGDTAEIRIKLPQGLNDGEYYVEPALANESGSIFYDNQERAATFFINGSNNPYSLIHSSGQIVLTRKAR